MFSLKKAETTLYAELIRRGLPGDYARRTAEELDDHRADLLADLKASNAVDPITIADDRLGETRQLAKKIAGDYQRRSWFGRWPLVSFLLLPPALLIASWFAIGAAIAAISITVNWLVGPGGPAEYTTGRNLESAWAFYYFTVMVFGLAVPAAMAWWYGRFAMVGAQPRAYLLMACLSFGLMNGLVHHQVMADPDNAERASNGFGIMLGDVGSMTQYFMRPMQIAQMLVPVLAGGALLFRDERRRRAALLAPAVEDERLRLAA